MKILLYEPVYNFTLEHIAEQLKNVSDDEQIELRINSPGGDVFAGLSIANLLRSMSNKVIVYVDGLAASIASIITMAADEVVMSEGSFLMVHNSKILADGNKEELANNIELLAKIDEVMTNMYVARTGLPKDEIEAIMEAETFITAEQAVELGFADSTIEPVKMAAIFKINNDMKAFDKLMDLFKQSGAAEPTAEEQEAIDKLNEAAEAGAQKIVDKKKTGKGLEAITGDFATNVDFLPFKELTGKQLTAFAEYVTETQEIINKIPEMVKDASAEAVANVLAEYRSKAQAPSPTPSFAESEEEETEIEKLNKLNASIQDRLAEIEKKQFNHN